MGEPGSQSGAAWQGLGAPFAASLPAMQGAHHAAAMHNAAAAASGRPALPQGMQGAPESRLLPMQLRNTCTLGSANAATIRGSSISAGVPQQAAAAAAAAGGSCGTPAEIMKWKE